MGTKARKYVERVRGCQPGWLARVDRLLDHVLPGRCVVCGLAAASPGICPGCRRGLPWSAAACRLCGLPLPAARGPECGACLVRPPPFDRVLSAFWYEFPVRQLIGQYKFRRDVATGRALAELWAGCIEDRAPQLVHGLIPVPLHGFRLFQRGFNQAFDLARTLSRRTGIPLQSHDLRRTRHTPRQAGLDADTRRRNVSAAFAWHGRPLRGERLALVDDVMTTGATLCACAHTLRRAGAGHVEAWVLARAVA